MINGIIARNLINGIGYQNKLPWKTNPEDMKWFRDNTLGHVVLMGRNTWESLGNRSLPKRINAVMSNYDVVGNPHHVYSDDIEIVLDNLKLIYPHLHIWVIGGKSVFEQAMPYMDNVYLTTIPDTSKSDTFIDSLYGFVPSYYSRKGDTAFEIRIKA